MNEWRIFKIFNDLLAILKKITFAFAEFGLVAIGTGDTFGNLVHVYAGVRADCIAANPRTNVVTVTVVRIVIAFVNIWKQLKFTLT